MFCADFRLGGMLLSTFVTTNITVVGCWPLKLHVNVRDWQIVTLSGGANWKTLPPKGFVGAAEGDTGLPVTVPVAVLLVGDGVGVIVRDVEVAEFVEDPETISANATRSA